MSRVLNYAWLVTKTNERGELTKAKEIACKSVEVRKCMVCSETVSSSIFLLFMNCEEKWMTDEVEVWW